jgi:hypothetical protein
MEKYNTLITEHMDNVIEQLGTEENINLFTKKIIDGINKDKINKDIEEKLEQTAEFINNMISTFLAGKISYSLFQYVSEKLKGGPILINNAIDEEIREKIEELANSLLNP